MDSISLDEVVKTDTGSLTGNDFVSNYPILPPIRRTEQKIIEILNQIQPTVFNSHNHIRVFLQRDWQNWCVESSYIDVSDNFLEKIRKSNYASYDYGFRFCVFLQQSKWRKMHHARQRTPDHRMSLTLALKSLYE